VKGKIAIISFPKINEPREMHSEATKKEKRAKAAGGRWITQYQNYINWDDG